MRRIHENDITGTSCSSVLIGAPTWGRKYVDWKIKAMLESEHGPIRVYLPTGVRDLNNNIRVPNRFLDDVQSGFALWLSWQAFTASVTQLERYGADAKGRSAKLIVNNRGRRLYNGNWRAVAWFAHHGVRIERVMTDNGSAYKSFAFRDLLAEQSIRPSGPDPGPRAPTAKPSASSKPACANGPTRNRS
jgi:hypothetical protein